MSTLTHSVDSSFNDNAADHVFLSHPSTTLHLRCWITCLLLDEFSVSLTCDYRLNITEIDYISYYDKGEIECSELSYLFAS
ncbi:hypothetical protein QYF36_003830 [Acer negundo]|nr:hypothetical protein QYF36_003830 [Acer negundo]